MGLIRILRHKFFLENSFGLNKFGRNIAGGSSIVKLSLLSQPCHLSNKFVLKVCVCLLVFASSKCRSLSKSAVSVTNNWKHIACGASLI